MTGKTYSNATIRINGFEFAVSDATLTEPPAAKPFVNESFTVNFAPISADCFGDFARDILRARRPVAFGLRFAPSRKRRHRKPRTRRERLAWCSPICGHGHRKLVLDGQYYFTEHLETYHGRGKSEVTLRMLRASK